MKRIYSIWILAIAVVLGTRASAQMVGDCVFLQGRYVEVGVAPNGGYGSPVDAPSGYHPNFAGTALCDPGRGTSVTSSRYLGFVADYGRDGWTTGTPPYFGDYYLPGTPQEGWTIQVGTARATAYIPNYQSGCTGYTGALSGTSIGYSNVGGVMKGVWQGTFAGLRIRQTTKLDTNDLFFTVNVVMTNTTSAPINNIYYVRTLDPDNEQTRAGGYTTVNRIDWQIPNPTNKVLVSTTGVTYSNAYLGLGTKDCRAKCMIFNAGLFPSASPDSMWNQLVTGYLYNPAATNTNDVGVALDYKIGTIAANDSTSITYAYILNAAYIDSALNATQPNLYVNSSLSDGDDTINLCAYTLPTLTIRIDTNSFYRWHWTPGTGGIDTTAISNTVTVSTLPITTTYTITGVNISGGCDTIKYRLTLTRNPFGITFNNRDTAICVGNSVGSNVTSSGVLTYAWSPAAGVSNTTLQNPVFTPTVTTTYTLVATGASGCPPTTHSFTIVVYDPPTSVSFDSLYVKTCVGVPVALHATAVPTGVYNYSWSPATGLSNTAISNPVVTPTAAGDIVYTVTVTSGIVSGCSVRDTMRVHTLPNDFTLNNRDTIICRGQSVIGSITGPSEFRYSWSPVTGVSNITRTNPTITPTVSTTYTAAANYARCPEMRHSFSIRVDTLAPSYNFVDTICLGVSDSFDIRVAGPDTGSNDYTYRWTPAADLNNDTIPNPVITPVTAGVHVYNATVSPAALGCSSVSTVTLNVIPNTVSVSPHDTTICKGNFVQVLGSGHPLFSYQWLPTSGIPLSRTLNARISPDTTQTYILIASYVKCPDMHDTIRINVEPKPDVYLGGNRFLCDYDTMHLRAVVTPEWFTGYNYAWSPATDLDMSTSQSVVFNGRATTKLYVDVTTSAGCAGKDSMVITVFPGNFGGSLPDRSFCPGEEVTLVTTPLIPGVKYRWMPSKYVSDSFSSAPDFKPEATTTYTVVASTPEGCTDTFNFTATVYPAAVIMITDSVVLHPGETFHIKNNTNCVTFTWFPTAGLSNSLIPDPVANPELSTTYYVTGFNNNGCKAMDSISVQVEAGTIIKCPNAFTPGKGVNNTFYPNIKGIANLSFMRIYNRWGNLIFESKNLNQGWDGSYNGTPQPFGVYIYEIEAVTNLGKIVTQRGNVTLIR